MMTDEEFNAFVQRSNEDLKRKQALLAETYGVGKHADFLFDQTTGNLQFKDASGNLAVEAVATPIGSLSAKGGTWQWGWANKSLLGPLRERSEKLKELYAKTGVGIFNMPTFKADEQMAWEMVAMAVSHLDSLGCYRAPSKGLQVFLSIDTAASKP